MLHIYIINYRQLKLTELKKRYSYFIRNVQATPWEKLIRIFCCKINVTTFQSVLHNTNKTYSCPNPRDCMMSSMKFRLKSSPQYRLLTGNSMEFRQVPILTCLPSSVWGLNKIVPLLILLLKNLLPVRKNKTFSSLIFTFRYFSTPDVMSIWINSFTTPLSTSPKILIQLYIISCSIFYFSSHSLYFTSLKLSWSILNSFIVSSLKSFKFLRTFNSLRPFKN